MDEFNGWLSMLVERNGSDLHLKVDAAVSASSNPHDFTLQLQQSGISLPS